ncbi:hypothetical protein HYPSUDRAFT_110366, partial [Hypholoma sublateritium FD-334 SS-4]
YEVIRPIHNVPQLSGRATHVWLVRRKDVYYVLKDSWPLASKPFSEIRHLLKINQTILQNPTMYDKLKHTYPILVIGQELLDDTGVYRKSLQDTFFSRVHRRIVTKPIGDPLTSFRSKYELCSVLCDVVKYLEFSSQVCSVCHGDISLSNVTIHRIFCGYNDKEINVFATPAEADIVTATPTEAGIVTASPTEAGIVTASPTEAGIDKNTVRNDNNLTDSDDGTLPYMALESLKWVLPSEFTHEPRHDLESLFYVILTLCTYVNYAGCLRSPIALDDELSVCLNEWWATLDGHVLVRNKAQHIALLDDLVLQRLPPYWEDFHPYLRAL